MKARPTLCLRLALLASCLIVSSAAASPGRLANLAEDEFPGVSVAFELEGTNGYSIGFAAYDEEGDGKGRFYVSVRGKGSSAFYSAPAALTESAVRADLGALGKIDLVARASGRRKTIHVKCSDEKFTYEPATYEGTVDFRGEEGYTQAHATRVAKAPTISSFCGGSGSGEATGVGLPGARLRGLSFARGRTLSFQFNKNRPLSRTLFSASLKEREGRVFIVRDVKGRVPASAFRFDESLQDVTLSPPAPFSGSASLRRTPNAVSPFLEGDLAVDFPGRSHVLLGGPTVHISIAHARYTRSGQSGYAEIGL